MKNFKSSQSGQALIELIVFLPLIITLYSVISGFANSINGSINQQKVTRSYFYYRIQNNSNIPGPRSFYPNWKVFGMYYIGWKDKFEGSEESPDPIMPCYKVSIPFKNEPEDACGEAYTKKESTWIRVGTVYGVCGTTFFNNNGKVFAVPDGGFADFSVLTERDGCIITQ
jgi:hypothetical protein